MSSALTTRSNQGDPFVSLCFQVPSAEIGYLRFILEGYDGLAQIRTLDVQQGLIELMCSASQRTTLDSLLAALAEELPLREQPFPKDYCPL